MHIKGKQMRIYGQNVLGLKGIINLIYNNIRYFFFENDYSVYSICLPICNKHISTIVVLVLAYLFYIMGLVYFCFIND